MLVATTLFVMELQIIHKDASNCFAYVYELLCHCGLYFLFSTQIYYVSGKPS